MISSEEWLEKYLDEINEAIVEEGRTLTDCKISETELLDPIGFTIPRDENSRVALNYDSLPWYFKRKMKKSSKENEIEMLKDKVSQYEEFLEYQSRKYKELLLRLAIANKNTINSLSVKENPDSVTEERTRYLEAVNIGLKKLINHFKNDLNTDNSQE